MIVEVYSIWNCSNAGLDDKTIEQRKAEHEAAEAAHLLRWMPDRPMAALYVLPEIVRRAVLWMTRKEPRWRRERWKAKT